MTYVLEGDVIGSVKGTEARELVEEEKLAGIGRMSLHK